MFLTTAQPPGRPPLGGRGAGQSRALRPSRGATMPTIEQVVAGLQDWQGRQIEMERLSGGLTNTNFKVTVDGAPYFVRIPGESTELLAVDRRNEHFNAQAAADSGVGPRILYHLPEFDVMVLEFLKGDTMSNAQLGRPEMPGRIAAAIKRLHAGKRFLHDFDMFRLTEYYLGVCRERGIPMPEGYPERMPAVKRIEHAISAHPLATVPCHNDLLAENYMDVSGELRLIDYEYSGNNDPCFELGNTCQELQYDEARQRQVCAGYFGTPSDAMLARMKLYMIMSDVGWGLWAAIQARISNIDYDFWGWAVERWGRAVQKMDSMDFEDWLVQVQG
ncbi:MAG TPA: choline/ethanolamine kinase family protein [Anaerolineales bacterium]|nr:choline/ethanolamine kinase family protein [Anaerolineales bacterium]